MKKVEAYEHNGKLYKTKNEAYSQRLFDGVADIFYRCERVDIIRKIVYEKDTQKKLVELIEEHQGEVEE